MHNSRQFLTIFLLSLGLLAFAAPVEEKLLFTIQDKAADFTLPGIGSAPVAFGSDAPHLTGFAHKAICGPGSIRTAHRSDECLSAADLEHAVRLYKEMYRFVQLSINK